MGLRALLIVFLTLFSTAGMALDIAVRVKHEGSNQIGKTLTFYLKDQIEKSATMHLANENDDLIIIELKTFDPPGRNQSDWTIYSVAWLVDLDSGYWPYYLTSTVGFCGVDRVEACAQALTADTYEYATFAINQLTKVLLPEDSKSPKSK